MLSACSFPVNNSRYIKVVFVHHDVIIEKVVVGQREWSFITQGQSARHCFDLRREVLDDLDHLSGWNRTLLYHVCYCFVIPVKLDALRPCLLICHII